MINKKHIHILEVFSILLFSLLANFIFTLNIDFQKTIDYIEFLKLIFISISTFNFYFMVDKLKKILATATDEYNSESDISEKASSSIANRYSHYYKKKQRQINIQILLSVLFLLLFFLIEAFIKLFR